MSARPPSTRRGIVIGLTIGFGGALVLVLVALLAIGVLGGPTSLFSPPEHRISIDGEHLSVELTVPGDLAIDEVAAGPDGGSDPDCRGVRYEFGSELTVEAFAADCAADAPQQIMNGHHGTYRTLADVPEPVDTEEVATGAGPAQVFVQHYEEHTNFSDSWEEPVAVVTLDDPVDAEFPTLVLRSDKAALSREELTEIAASLNPIGHRLE
ncbi:hypothetical protein [Glycomyces tenuis]|uniref:hypothetical protein n=1 Tax=Glycomyces tenuis TaxID=58116 RepID=UPI0003F4B1FC|nr:hypothetical protein [Glycomyces tenuis]